MTLYPALAISTGLKDVFPKSRRRPHPPWARRILMAAASLTTVGCATQEYIRTYTYDYTEHHRLGAERRASQEINDACYFSGAQYPELVGPPQIVSEGEGAGKRFQATQSFYCVGTRGGP